MKKPTTLEEFRQSGGKARWRGISKKARSTAMKEVRKGGTSNTTQKAIDDEQAR